MAGMTSPNGMPTNVARSSRARRRQLPAPVRMDFGNFLATGPVGSAFAPFVPGGSSSLQQDMRA